MTKVAHLTLQIFGAFALLAHGARAEAASNKLIVETLPSAIVQAVRHNYDIGRHQVDSGGLASMTLLKNTRGLETFQILRELMLSDIVAEVRDIAQMACHSAGLTGTACVRGVLDRKSSVRANYQFHTLEGFLADMEGWDMEDSKWYESLNLIGNYAKGVLGAGFKSYAFGYDDVADVFAIVMISQNKKTILVVTGDYGA